LHRPVNIALLRIDSLRFRERDDQVAGCQRPVIDFPARRIEVAAFSPLDIAADDGNNVLPLFQPGTIDNRNVRMVMQRMMSTSFAANSGAFTAATSTPGSP